MKRLVSLTVIATLIISLVAPSGATFALTGGVQAEISPEATAPSESVVVGDHSADVNLTTNNQENAAAAAFVENPALTDDTTAPPPAQSPAPMAQDPAPFSSPTSAPPVADPEVAVPENAPIAPSTASSDSVVIAQIQVGSSLGAADEFVAIYNNSDAAIDVTGWCVRNKKGVNFACLSDGEFEMSARSYISLTTAPRAGDTNVQVSIESCSGSIGCIVASSDTIQLVSADGTIVNEIAWTNGGGSSRYALERIWDPSAAYRFLSGKDSDAWAWRAQLAQYGFVEELVECADGSLVASEENCPDETPEMPDILPLEVTELLPNPKGADDGAEFIELYNPNDVDVDLAWWEFYLNGDDKKPYKFPDGLKIGAGEYLVVKNSDVAFSLRNSSGSLSLRSLGGQFTVDVPTWQNAKDDKSWALIAGVWQFAEPSPGVENPEPIAALLLQAQNSLADCGEGRERNPATGRCRNIPTVKELAPCRDGQYRSEETGRCRNIALAGDTLKPCKEGQYRSEETNRCRSIASAASALKPCRDDQFRNPETGRCKKIASAEEVADCGEGRERNPETNRCRNVRTASMPLANFPTEPVTKTAGSTLGWWVFGGVTLLAVGYAGWQWRFELAKLLEKIRGNISSAPKA